MAFHGGIDDIGLTEIADPVDQRIPARYWDCGRIPGGLDFSDGYFQSNFPICWIFVAITVARDPCSSVRPFCTAVALCDDD